MNIGETLMLILLAQYALISVAFLLEGNYAKGCYWIGAFVITSSVVLMK